MAARKKTGGTNQIGGKISNEAARILNNISAKTGISKTKLIEKAIMRLPDDPKIQAVLEMME
jgi:hypothetical protein